MLFRREAQIAMGQHSNTMRIRFGPLLKEMVRVSFDREKCFSAVRAELERVGLGEACLSAGRIDDDLPVFSDEVLFPGDLSWKMDLIPGGGRGKGVSFDLEEGQLHAMADFIRWSTRTKDLPQLQQRLEALGGPGFADSMLEPDAAAARPRWPRAEGPSVQRREHASLAIRSRTTSLLLDPICLVRALPCILDSPTAQEHEVWDAVAITHSHGDHWHLPTILHQGGSADTTVIVPQVPRPNLLTPVSFADALCAVGQSFQAPPWESTVRIGDIEIDIIPFRGEQPTRDAPGAVKGARSWGNCYRFNTPELSALVLVDSGRDPDGDIVEAVRANARRRGPVDFAMSCLRTFSSPFFGGLSTYWAPIPFGRIVELHSQFVAGKLPVTTAGAEGIAAACAASGASYFLPYANGFEGVGHPVTDIGWGNGEASEASALEQLAAELKARGAPTEILEWDPGDVLVPGAAGGKPSLRRLRDDG